MNKRIDINIIEDEYLDEDYYEEIDDEIDYSSLCPEDAKRFKEDDEEFDRELEELMKKSEEEINLRKDPEYMRKFWYEIFIESGWSPDEAAELAAAKIKKKFGI